MSDRGTHAKTERLLIRQGEACQRLGISRMTLIAEIEAGRLRYVLVGRRRKFKPGDLEAYIERQGRGCDANGVLSHDAKGGRAISRTSRSKVIDFATSWQTTKNKPRS